MTKFSTRSAIKHDLLKILASRASISKLGEDQPSCTFCRHRPEVYALADFGVKTETDTIALYHACPTLSHLNKIVTYFLYPKP